MIEVPDFCGMQALDAWLLGHDLGLLLVGPDPDSPEPLMHGIVTQQKPLPGTTVARWDPVTVWVRRDDSGVREPLRPLPPRRADSAFFDED
ncbi:PASTA domain-containing protein [Nocardia sp. XZ_19_385]|uniref:PASTA domain-containing protein n=1 Tax=Nocardia sp. XZ_19_385 TaxID=2769488 RepID=UPI00188FBF86|nr:PASTA domain-containing protein [Nocardia sp. XZ_19_385]